MPIIYSKHIDSVTEIGLWYLDENTQELITQVHDIDSNIDDILSIKHEKRQRSSLAVRLLLKSIIKTKICKLRKDEFGKPFLENDDHYISLSHSEDLAAVIISSKKCGIDVQIYSEKVMKIAPKFLHKSEYSDDPKQLHLLWSAKEAIYKANGKKSIQFNEDIIIELGNINSNFGLFNGILKRNQKIIKYNLKYEIWNQYYLVYAIQS